MSNGSTNDKDGPDFIGYYRHLFSMEISKIEDQPTSLNVDTFFSNCLGGGISDHKKDKLRSILHDAASILNKEVDEIFEKIVAELKAESDLGQSSCFSGNSNKGSIIEASVSRKRKKTSVPDFSRENGFCSSQLAEKLCMMEEGIEKFINEVVVNCRAMTSAEKQQLGRKIQKLPEKAYDRLIEIFQSRNPFTRQNSDSVFINLEKQDDGTLWRLYYYVETVLRASKI